MTDLAVLRTGRETAVSNMALDAALLHTPGLVPTLRLYGWEPAAVSLGRFQDHDVVRAAIPDEGPRPLDVVRRATGGGAIYHADELTFAFVCDLEHMPGGPDVSVGTAAIHDAIVDALSDVGVEARRLTPAELGDACRQRARPTHAWCFEEPGPHDIVTPDGRKLVGSAQRRIRRPTERVLVHGSIPLRRPPAPATSASLADQVDPTAVAEQLAERLVVRIAQASGTHPTPVRTETPPDIEATAHELRDRVLALPTIGIASA